MLQVMYVSQFEEFVWVWVLHHFLHAHIAGVDHAETHGSNHEVVIDRNRYARSIFKDLVRPHALSLQSAFQVVTRRIQSVAT